MTLARWMVRDPFLSPFGFMEEILGRARTTGATGGDSPTWVPFIDVRETNEHYVVLVDLPGVEQDKIAVEFENGVLTISGERPRFEDDSLRRVERPYGTFLRSLSLPEGIDAELIKADYRDGVLELLVPKPVQRKPRRIELASSQKSIASQSS